MPSARWVVERHGIRILSDRTEGTLLEGLEAAAWDMVARGDSTARTAAKLASIGRLAIEDADQRLRGWLKAWRSAGWLPREESLG
jgi:hypothetical protein